MHDLKVRAVGVTKMDWVEDVCPPTGGKYYVKVLASSAEGDGIDVFCVKYPKGYTTVWHTHPCAHGIYVLEGTLKTHEGLYGPGSFVWLPEGLLMEHGATEKEDVTFLFICNKAFGIDYAGQNYSINYKK